MTPEIKNLIEQIQRGEVPEGYKRTKVGIVPYEWSCAKMSDMFDRLNRKNKVGNTNVLTISAQHGLISQEKFFNKSVASEDKGNYFLLKQGNFAYNKSYSNGYPFGAIKCLTAYDSGIVSPLYICFEPAKENQCPEYFAQYFDGGFLNREIHAVAQEGARNHGLLNIGVDDFFSLNITVPPLAEQKKIAEILAAQDRVIELYQRKIDEIKKLKKICLSKMFPQKGHNAPEIRFPEFTDAWEQRKLGDIGSVAMCRRIFKHQTSESGEIPFFKIGTFGGEPDAFITRELFEEFKAKYPYPDKGDILISASGSIGRTVEFTGGNEYFQDSNIVWLKHDKSIINPFLRHLYSVVEWAGIEGSTIKRLYNDNILKTEVMLPSVQEQTKIAEMLDGIDSLITLHQRKLEELQKSKKALMQLLLTGIVRVNV